MKHKQPLITGFCVQIDGLTTDEVLLRTGMANRSQLYQAKKKSGFIETAQATYIHLKKNTWREYSN